MLWLMMSMSANADTFTLDSGAVIEGEMVVYNYGGECQMSVMDGDLVGAIVLIPCDRIVSFSKTPTTPAPPMEAPALTAAAVEAAVTPLAAPLEVVPPVAGEEVLEVEVVAAPPEVVAVTSEPEVAPFAAQPAEAPVAAPAEAPVAAPAEEVVAAPIEEEPEAMASTPWADESGAPADGLIRPEATQPDRTIGGVAIPALPNLRIIRTEGPTVAPEADQE